MVFLLTKFLLQEKSTIMFLIIVLLGKITIYKLDTLQHKLKIKRTLHIINQHETNAKKNNITN
jgi:hypothetical protein